MEDVKKFEKSQKTNIRLINNKKRKRDQSEKEKDEIPEENELKIFLSNEGYERTSIFTGIELPYYLSEFSDYALFERKKFVDGYIKDGKNEYTIEQMLTLDDTNEDLQTLYAKKIVDMLSIEKDKTKREILLEKLQKSQIIIREGVYNEIISKISDLELRNKVSYINF